MNATLGEQRPSMEGRLQQLVQLADQATIGGKRDEARQLLSQARTLAPEHPLVLNGEAFYELHHGDAAAARSLLERAISQETRVAALWMNLAAATRKLGLADEEGRAIEGALAAEPRNLSALLQKASLLERRGKAKAAATFYGNALATIPPGARVPQSLRPMLEHALQTVRRNTEDLERFLGPRLEETRARHAGADFARFEHCVGGVMGRRGIFTPRPTFLHFPKVPHWEFYPRDHFQWLGMVESETAVIRAEMERVMAEDSERLEPYIAYPEGVPLDQWKELNHSRRWSAFYLWREGTPNEANLARCPRTAEIIARLPLAQVPGHAPTVFFSILDAKTRIPPHTGVTNTRVIAHLPLVVPPGCGFRVGSEKREWKPGEAWVFDDTIEHEAWNESDVPRGILIFDVWNPFLDAAERELVRELVAGIGEYYGDESTFTRFV
jgi:aspartate beta-hydroxylase